MRDLTVGIVAEGPTDIGFITSLVNKIITRKSPFPTFTA